MAKRGRPSDYNPEIAAAICAEIAQGKSLRTICAANDKPAVSTVFMWITRHPEFAEQYTRAKEDQATAMAEEIIDIADDGTNDWMAVNRGGNVAWVANGEALQRSRLRVDTRKWLMSKMVPKKYGERLTQEHEGGLSLTLSVPDGIKGVLFGGQKPDDV